MIETTDSNFKKDSEKGLVLVDFFATWCPPCKAMTPHLKAISDELKDSCTILKLDVDANQETTAAFQVKAMPTFVLLQDGVEVDRMVGACPKDKMVEFITKDRSK